MVAKSGFGGGGGGFGETTLGFTTGIIAPIGAPEVDLIVCLTKEYDFGTDSTFDAEAYSAEHFNGEPFNAKPFNAEGLLSTGDFNAEVEWCFSTSTLESDGFPA
ncbi:hypothetical protein NDU88_005621 [Pleurodeles waltl]|uniref:Uncharacterized protein n=1 Tax=Pleurodeles waltl TaxID=8319 RepID=A0AAV7MWV7_PLEWA|nr:hypothetical protein NDU88_005621 [Pleurodeles waltl]